MTILLFFFSGIPVLLFNALFACYQCSYIKGLAPKFNMLVDDFLKKLKPLANGQTEVPLKDHIHGFVLTVVSEVRL